MPSLPDNYCFDGVKVEFNYGNRFCPYDIVVILADSKRHRRGALYFNLDSESRNGAGTIEKIQTVVRDCAVNYRKQHPEVKN